MAIQEVVRSLQLEKRQGVESRFPCRAIMVKTIDQYCTLLEELKKISECEVVPTEVLFSSYDVMPDYEQLKDPEYRDKWIILTGVSEYLRLFSKSEAENGRFASLWHHQVSSESKGRILIPLWGCWVQWNDTSLNLTSDIRQDDFFMDCTDNDDEPEMDLLVLSGRLESHVSKLEAQQRMLFVGLKEWFGYWENPKRNKTEFLLVTKRSQRVIPAGGSISVRVNNDMLSLIRENLSGAEILDTGNCTEEMQHELIDYALDGSTLDEALLVILNLSRFSGKDIMGKWWTLSDAHKRFVALWLKLHPDNTYLCRCFEAADSIDNVIALVGHKIFDMRSDNPAWIDEYKDLVTVLQLEPDAEFFSSVDAIAEYESKLDFLTSRTQSERVYILQMVSRWMRKDPVQFYESKKLEGVYPELSAYLQQNSLDANMGAYMKEYKSYKLGNTLPNDEEIYFNGVSTIDYEYRYSVLSTFLDNNTIVLWIDALGVEWLPLLAWSISQKCDVAVKKAAITLANLPTDTCFNGQWKEMDVPYKKLDALDKLAHKGVIDDPDYYACIEKQIAFVAGLHEYVSQLMERYQRVIITGDHGTSRLAARFFHNREGIVAPPDAMVCSHGRYCVLPNKETLEIPNTVKVKDKDGKQYVVLLNYDHFRQSGFAAGADDDRAIYGEVHGGATPEEVLVPVLVVDSNRELPLIAEWLKPSSKVRQKKVSFDLVFNRAISELVVKINGIIGSAIKKDENDLVWRIEFINLKPGKYLAEVLADQHIITMPEVEVISALGGGMGDLP